MIFTKSMKIVPPDSASSLLYPKPEITKGQIICITEIRDSDAGALLLCTGTMMGRRKDLYEFMRGSQPTEPFYVRVADLPSHKVLGYASFIHERMDLYDEYFLKNAEEIARNMSRCQSIIPELLDPTHETVKFYVTAYSLSLSEESTLNKRNRSIGFTLSYNPVVKGEQTKIEATITSKDLDAMRQTIFSKALAANSFLFRLRYHYHDWFPPLSFVHTPYDGNYTPIFRQGLQEYGWSCEDRNDPYPLFVIDSKHERKRYASLKHAREDLTSGLEKLLDQFDRC